MTSGPGGPWLVDFDYADDEQVQLDLPAIIAHGTRIRRKRLRDKIATVMLLCGIGAVAVVAGRLAVAPDQAAGVASSQGKSGSGESSTAPGPPKYNEDAGIVGHDFGPFEQVPRQVPLVVETSAKLPGQFGPMQALVGDTAESAVWYVGTSSKVVLFNLSAKGVVRSWPLASTSDVPSWSRFSAFAGLSVASDGTAWIGIASTLLRVDTKTGGVSSWSIPPARAVYDRPGSRQPVRSLAVSSSGSVVVVVVGNSSAVQIFNVMRDTWHQVRMPKTRDQPEAAGYSRAGALVVGYRSVTRLSRRSGVLLVARHGPVLTAAVADARAVAAYGKSSALVGVGTPDVVSATATVRPLQLPESPVDISGSVHPLVSLPDARFATAIGAQIMSFPAHATSAGQATQAASLYDTAPQGCQAPDELTAANPAEPSGSLSTACPQGYQMLTTDAIGDFWVVRTAAKRTVELLARQ